MIQKATKLSIYIPRKHLHLVEKLKQIAEENGMSLNTLVRLCLIEYLKRKDGQINRTL